MFIFDEAHHEHDRSDDNNTETCWFSSILLLFSTVGELIDCKWQTKTGEKRINGHEWSRLVLSAYDENTR